ncbi:MAG: hypothetical protein H8K03_21170 [Nitrospira sp.]
MTIRHMGASIVMMSVILFNTGCSLMIDPPKGDTPAESTLKSESKSLAGVYADLGSDGSIQPHSESVGQGGRINGLIILGGPADMPDMKTGKTTIKGSTDTTPTVKMGETTFSSGSGSNSTGSSGSAPKAGGK